MKHFYVLMLFWLAGTVTSVAQGLNTIVFTNEGGDTFVDGSVINVSTVVEDDFGEKLLPSGLFLKKLSGSLRGVRIHVAVESLDNGDFQICFPTACISKSQPQTFITPSDVMAAGEQRDLQTEWLPQGFGRCKVTYQVQLMEQTSVFPPKYDEGAMGAKITVEYVFADPSGISGVTEEPSADVVSRYDLVGRPLANSSQGIHIVRRADGKTVKLAKTK